MVVGFLSFGIFVLLINMTTNRPQFDPESLPLPSVNESSTVGDGLVVNKVSREKQRRLWGEPGPFLQPCWEERLTVLKERPWGYIGVVLSNGPHYHHVQMAEAVVIAKYLGATLLLPTIKNSENEPNGQFDNIYHTGNFIKSLQGVLRVVGRLPDDLSSVSPAVVSVPYEATPSFIEENVRPALKRSAVVIIGNFFVSRNKMEETLPELEALRCLVMYKALQFQPSVTRLGDHIISRLREAGGSAGGHFVCIDLLTDSTIPKNCSSSREASELPKSRKCVDITGIGTLLVNFGFEDDTAIYLTQSRHDPNLEPLTNIFKNVHTKEYSMPFNEEKQVLYSGRTQFEKALDYYICSRSDLFVPTVSNMFYSNVAGERIRLQNTNMLVPSLQCRSTNFSTCTSRYVTQKDHFVYKCLCSVSDKS
ncbi:Uncharacterized protein EJ110_NYTH17427 [Nymphaea thermarum]|nr:Uncharacterized protein EJ110_NYTH17427 [Nymphaea thermarum]